MEVIRQGGGDVEIPGEMMDVREGVDEDPDRSLAPRASPDFGSNGATRRRPKDRCSAQPRMEESPPDDDNQATPG